MEKVCKQSSKWKESIEIRTLYNGYVYLTKYKDKKKTKKNIIVK